MTDFSDKYRRAIDSLDISPDFKERAAAKMIALRDGGERVSAEAHVRRRKIRRIMYTVGAAAACIAVCAGVVFTGVLDRESDIFTVTESETAVPEETDVLPREEPAEEEIKATVTESMTESFAESVTAVTVEADMNCPENEEAEAEKTVEYAVTTAAPAVETSAAATEARTAAKTPAETVGTMPVTIAGTIPETGSGAAVAANPGDNGKTGNSGNSGKSGKSGESETLPTVEAEYVAPISRRNNDDEIYDDDEVIDEAPLNPVPATSENENIEVDDYDYDGADSGYDEAPAEAAPQPSPMSADNTSGGAFNDPAFDYKDAVGYDFSAYDEAKKFDKKNAYATVTPLFEEYDEKSNKIISYKAAEVRGTVKMRELISAAALYAEDGTWEAVSSPPEDSRYIIDFADEEGNSLRAYCGNGFICYAVADMKGNEPANDVVYCYFKLTEKESAKLEGILYSHID